MFPVTIICLLLLIIGAVSADCPDGYEVVGPKCIHRSTGGYLTYDNAVTYCYQHFGRLPVLKDCVSFTDVATYVNDGYADATNGYWLGATNLSANNVWQWSDGTAVQMGAPYWATVSQSMCFLYMTLHICEKEVYLL
ncbi:uncharacterized protein LOC125178654 [Hyalella azteca]|uniref:Uncharacterized protein LOC125178654 n=1 Tax=Hyalella azteca TaxID=294128 RepID=A0A979FP73_HYAAZ|nr:uncharacterized protein LOC125178654 [Hyalella azteca]